MSGEGRAQILSNEQPRPSPFPSCPPSHSPFLLPRFPSLRPLSLPHPFSLPLFSPSFLLPFSFLSPSLPPSASLFVSFPLPFSLPSSPFPLPAFVTTPRRARSSHLSLCTWQVLRALRRKVHIHKYTSKYVHASISTYLASTCAREGSLEPITAASLLFSSLTLALSFYRCPFLGGCPHSRPDTLRVVVNAFGIYSYLLMTLLWIMSCLPACLLLLQYFTFFYCSF